MRSDVAVQIYGDDLELLERKADEVVHLLQEVRGVNWVTPYLEAPRCQYLRNG